MFISHEGYAKTFLDEQSTSRFAFHDAGLQLDRGIPVCCQ
jgi:hypothetical protein